MQPLLDGMKAADVFAFAATLFILKMMGYGALVVIGAMLKYTLVRAIWKAEFHHHQHPPAPPLIHPPPLGHYVPPQQAPMWEQRPAPGAPVVWLTRALALVGFLSILLVVLAGVAFTIAKANDQNKRPTTTPQSIEEAFL